MRKHSDYIPRHKLKFNTWLENFVAEIEKNVTKFGISKDELDILKPLAEDYHEDMEAEMELLTKKLAQFKKTVEDRKKVEKLCRGLSQKIKNDFYYTEEIGRKFDIIGAEKIFNPKTFKPKLKLLRVSNGVRISFTKSQTDGVNIYRCIEGKTEWEFLVRDTNSPYVDTKEMDKHVNYWYMAHAVIDDKEIGLESGIVEITV